MEVNSRLLQKYIPLIDPAYVETKPITKSSDTSLLVTTPEEIQRNLQRWREHNERIHIVV